MDLSFRDDAHHRQAEIGDDIVLKANLATPRITPGIVGLAVISVGD